MQEFEVLFYDKEDGSEPAKEFILSLDTKMRAKVLLLWSFFRITGPNYENPIQSRSVTASLNFAPKLALIFHGCCTSLL